MRTASLMNIKDKDMRTIFNLHRTLIKTSLFKQSNLLKNRRNMTDFSNEWLGHVTVDPPLWGHNTTHDNKTTSTTLLPMISESGVDISGEKGRLDLFGASASDNTFPKEVKAQTTLSKDEEAEESKIDNPSEFAW